MSKETRIKEELAWLKIVFTIIITVSFSMLAWLAQNYHTASFSILIASFLVFILAVYFLVVITKIVYKKLDNLEKL